MCDETFPRPAHVPADIVRRRQIRADIEQQLQHECGDDEALARNQRLEREDHADQQSGPKEALAERIRDECRDNSGIDDVLADARENVSRRDVGRQVMNRARNPPRERQCDCRPESRQIANPVGDDERQSNGDDQRRTLILCQRREAEHHRAWRERVLAQQQQRGRCIRGERRLRDADPRAGSERQHGERDERRAAVRSEIFHGNAVDDQKQCSGNRDVEDAEVAIAPRAAEDGGRIERQRQQRRVIRVRAAVPGAFEKLPVDAFDEEELARLEAPVGKKVEFPQGSRGREEAVADQQQYGQHID